jgi:2-polyprenyl-3-methyl-5-hydroxy-6-metoxy-1,4-benzoquinol methylase
MDYLTRQKRAILETLLVCPSCVRPLELEADRYRCLACTRVYPVKFGIPRFINALSNDEEQVKRSFHLEHTRHLDSQHLHFTPKLVDQWLQDVQLPAEYFKGKLILDAGCGSGRWTYALASLGATVVAVDLTDAGVEVTYAATAEMPNVAVLQASVFNLPFRPESFDFVMSWGVLHHTPNTKAAFDRIVPFVKRGGTLYVMVYERHNPWKFIWTDLIRRVLRWFPEEQRYRLCRLFIIRSRVLFWLLRHRIICVPCPKEASSLDISTMQLGLYDAYAPVFNHLHSRQEVESWFRAYRFEQICLTRPVRFTSKKEIRLQGECGGSISMRGVRA